MTTIDTHPDGAAAADERSTSAVESFVVGAAQWVITTDHKRIGRIFIGFGLLALLATTALAALLGLERADDANSVVESDALLQLFQAYRVGLAFGAIVPIGLGLAVAVTPVQLGARTIAFPRVALTGCYVWLGGLALTVAALLGNGGMGGGDRDMVDLFLVGIGVMALGLAATASSVAASVLTARAPGMTMHRVPLFAWSTLIGSIAMLLVLPVVFGVVIYLFVDHRLGVGANFGGLEGMSAWLGWAFSVPALIVFSLPGIGVFAELMPVTFKHRQIMRGAMFAGIALVGVAAFAAVTLQPVSDVLFDTDGETFLRGLVPFLLLAGLPLLGVTIVLLLALGTAQSGVSGGAPSVRAPFVFGLLGFLLIGAGIAANALQGITDLELVDPVAYTFTTFEEGTVLLVVYGTILAAIGGVIFWAPKLWGRVVGDARAMPLALLGVLGALLAAVPMLIAGFGDQVGGVPGSEAEVAAMLATDGVDGAATWNMLSLIGHGLMGLTVIAFLGLLLSTFTGDGDDAEPNPYGAHTIEWATASPAPPTNYEHVPTVTSAEPLLDASTTPSADAASEGSPS